MVETLPWPRAYARALTTRDTQMLAAVVLAHPASLMLAERTLAQLAAIVFGRKPTARDRAAVGLLAEIMHDMEAEA